MADSKMVEEDVEEEGHGNLLLEMIKEVRKDVNVTVTNEDGETNHSVLDRRRLYPGKLNLRR